MPYRKSIKVDDEVYDRLQQLAKELGVDSPNKVLRRLLIDGAGPKPVPSLSNFAKRFFRCLESTGIDFVTVVSCGAWARALEELGDRPMLIAIEVRDFHYETTVVKDLENPVAYTYSFGRVFRGPTREELSLCALLGLLLALREELETGSHFRRLGHRCRVDDYGEYLAYSCFSDGSLGYSYTLTMVLRDVFDRIPRAESYIDVDGRRVRRVLTSWCHTFLGPLPMQEVPQALYTISETEIDARIGVSLCNAWNGTASGDMFIEIELEDRAKLEAVYNELVKIFGRKGVRKRRKSIKVESHVHTIAALYGVELGELRRLEDLSTVLGSIDNLVATILKRVFSCIGVAPSMRRA